MGNAKIDQDIKTYYTQRRDKELPADPITRARVESVLRDGYVVIPNAFTDAEALEAKKEIDRLHGDAPKVGRTIFEGYKTNRIFGILSKTRSFDTFCLIPAVRALNDYFLDEDYLLYVISSIVIQPNEKAQVLHYDDGGTKMPRPRPPLTIGTMIVLDDYTELNGATRIIPGSHKWGSDRLGDDEEAISITCPRGSVIYFLGTTWHSGGANRTDKPRYAATVQYCQPWMRPFENLMHAVDPRRALSGEIPKEITDMMGYRSAVPFYGYGKLRLSLPSSLE